MIRKKWSKYLLIFANIIFWLSVILNYAVGLWNTPPDYFYHFPQGITAAEREEELLRVEAVFIWKVIGNTLHLFLPFILIIYGNWFYLVRRYLAKEKYWGYIWRLVLLLFSMAFILSFHPEMNQSNTALRMNGNQVLPIPETLVLFTLCSWLIILTTPFYLSVSWFKQNAQLSALKNEKLETELSFLKSQINPHFFFNTLNNLYALTLENSKAAPEVILKLSDLMRYTIYDGRESAVPIAQEVRFIENYLELQKIRLYKKTTINFQKEISNPQLFLPPLLFVIFLENAFKHGVETLRDNAIVDLQLTENKGVIKFYCLNNYDHEERKIKGGLGLENIKRRLKLLFNQHYKLEIVDQENTYRIYLTINITGKE